MTQIKSRISNRKSGAVVLLLGVFFLLTGSLGSIAFADHATGYSISQINFSLSATQTTYEFQLNGPAEGTVSHVTIGNCIGEADEISHTAAAGEDDVIVYVEHGTDPTTGVTGHKWETDDSGDGEILVGAKFKLVYNGLFDNLDPQGHEWAVKKGASGGEQHFETGTTAGPTCLEPTTTTEEVTTTTEEVTTTTEEVTTTTEEVTTTTEEVTTTTEEPTTTTEEVTTTTEEGTTTTEDEEETTTTVLAVLGGETQRAAGVLPTTGAEMSSFLFLLGACLTLGGLLLVFGQRERREVPIQ